MADLFGKLVYIVGIPLAPERRLAVEVDKVQVIPHDMSHDIVNQGNRPVAPFFVRNDFGKDAVHENMPDDFIAAGRRFPCPVWVLSRLPA